MKLGTTDGYSNICKDCQQKYRKSVSKEKYQKKKERLDTDIQFKREYQSKNTSFIRKKQGYKAKDR